MSAKASSISPANVAAKKSLRQCAVHACQTRPAGFPIAAFL
jgi:hypothetical protein